MNTHKNLQPNSMSLPSTSLKLIFNDGTLNGKLTKEALDVCRLLAIDPEDVVNRTITDFQTPGHSE